MLEIVCVHRQEVKTRPKKITENEGVLSFLKN